MLPSRPRLWNDHRMEPTGRAQVAAQWLRSYRVWAIVGAFVVAAGLDSLDRADWLAAGALPVVTLVFLVLPGLETIARNFRTGYRGEA